MTTGIGCTVYVDGELLADGRTGDDELEPTALSGLSVVWGRSTTVDQPEPSTCEFDVMDLPGGAAFLTRLRTGLPVDVVASGEVYPDPDVPTMLDPGFDTTPIGSAPPSITVNGALQVTAERVARFTVLDASAAAAALFAPAPFDDVPAAWDDIPTTSPGQAWTVGASVRAPAGVTVALTPVLFSHPNGTHRLSPAGEQLTVTGTGDWQELSLTVVPQAYGEWVGVRVVISDLRRWVDIDGDWLTAAGAWIDRRTVDIDDLVVLAPAAGTVRTVAVFSGRITDLTASWDDTFGGTRVHVTAADFTAGLENVDIGDEPWQVEPMGDRFARILTLSGHDVEAQIDDSIAGIPVSYDDVDNQSVTGLLKDLAQSVDAIMWPAVHQTTGPYLRVEDPSNRAALFTLTVVDGLVQIVPAGTGPSAQDISACDVLRDPVEWAQTVADVSTRVAVTWLEQGVDDEGHPETTERTVTVIDHELERTYGVNRIHVSTLLESEDEARRVADRILARTSLTGWRASGFTIDDPDSLERVDDATIQMMFRLLDGTSRIGLPVRLTNLPEWTPAGTLLPIYLEGGTYTFDAGTWTLELTVSQAATQGESLPWSNLEPDWSWTSFDPAISWLDLTGVMYPPEQIGEPA